MLGGKLIAELMNVLNGGRILANWNEIIISLIPKSEEAREGN